MFFGFSGLFWENVQQIGNAVCIFIWRNKQACESCWYIYLYIYVFFFLHTLVIWECVCVCELKPVPLTFMSQIVDSDTDSVWIFFFFLLLQSKINKRMWLIDKISPVVTTLETPRGRFVKIQLNVFFSFGCFRMCVWESVKTFYFYFYYKKRLLLIVLTVEAVKIKTHQQQI